MENMDITKNKADADASEEDESDGKHEPNESGSIEEIVDDKELNDIPKKNGYPPLEMRSKRQIDTTSHTQDGIPIYDRGYGISLNGTEGLRIYQSLLTADGRGKAKAADISWEVTDSPVPAQNHRQNSSWKGKKDRIRHHSHKSSSSSSSSTSRSDGELNPQFAPAKEIDSRASTQVSRATPNVEFRSSRVKVSGADVVRDSSAPSSVQGDQKTWIRPQSIVAENHRINASSPSSVSMLKPTNLAIRGRQQQQQQQQPGNTTFQVAQTAFSNRYPDQTQTTIDKDDFVSRITAKKRVNKKQLRDLTHTTTAVHFVADSRNGTTASADNQGL